MRLPPLFTAITLLAGTFILPAGAQQFPLPVPLSLDGDPQPTSASGVPLSDAQCDGSGNLYVRYEKSGNSPSRIVKIAPDGSTQDIQLASIPGHPEEGHVYSFAVGDDGSLHEAVQSWDTVGTDPDLRIYYVRYDTDGSARSASPLSDDFTPFVLLPFPNGNFFAAGAIVTKSGNSIQESPRAAIFDSDATLISELHRTSPRPGKSPEPVLPDNSTLQPELVRVGADGNIYILLSSDTIQLKVFRPNGTLSYQLHLENPFENGMPHRLLVSGNRALVVYEGEAGNPEDSHVYVLYDLHTGEIVRAYRPDFAGTPVCMSDGRSVTILVTPPYPAKLSLGTASFR